MPETPACRSSGIEFIPSVHPIRGLNTLSSLTYLDETMNQGFIDFPADARAKWSAQSLVSTAHTDFSDPAIILSHARLYLCRRNRETLLP